MKVLIVDDEPLAIRRLQIALQGVPGLEMAGVANDGREALSAIASQRPDVVLLDIKMPGLDGFEVAEALAGPEAPSIIFVTAFDRFAVKAFETHAVDYLLKPVEFERLARAIERGRAHRRHQAQATELESLKAVLAAVRERPADAPPRAFERELWLRDRQDHVRVPVSDIHWISAERDYVRLHVGPRTYLMHETMQRLEERLDPASFARVHRSVLVQVDQVRSIRRTHTGALRAVLACGAEVPIGRRHAAFVERLVKPESRPTQPAAS